VYDVRLRVSVFRGQCFIFGALYPSKSGLMHKKTGIVKHIAGIVKHIVKYRTRKPLPVATEPIDSLFRLKQEDKTEEKVAAGSSVANSIVTSWTWKASTHSLHCAACTARGPSCRDKNIFYRLSTEKIMHRNAIFLHERPQGFTTQRRLRRAAGRCWAGRVKENRPCPLVGGISAKRGAGRGGWTGGILGCEGELDRGCVRSKALLHKRGCSLGVCLNS
jgi:hypothetical protein